MIGSRSSHRQQNNRETRMTATLTTSELRRAAERLSKVPLGHWPTPLDHLDRLSAELGVRVFVKRDDCSGFYLGGNKTRHNEYLIGDAIAAGCDVVVWGAELQSNNCRQTAAACARFGLDCHLVLSPGTHRRELQGNLLLCQLAGATVEVVDAAIGPELDAAIRQRADSLRWQGRKPYLWDRRRVLPLAAASYTVCLAEIVEQVPEFDSVYVSSAGATGAGLALGKCVLGCPAAIHSICPMTWPWDIPADLAATANAAADLMGLPHRIATADVSARTDFVGIYGRPSREGQAALHRLVRTEGILLDPIYSAKAFAALLADVATGAIPQGASVVFVHTGGTPAVFAMAREMLPEGQLPIV
jgi:1-aminocyclopropane-1-carboxylate deaminase/D-cysteine desulfhydrase-like pyridoxal-dependent ACC family enzyme